MPGGFFEQMERPRPGGEEARPEYVNTILVAFVVCPFRKDISLLGGQVAVFWLISCIAGTSVRFSVSASKRYQPLMNWLLTPGELSGTFLHHETRKMAYKIGKSG